MLRAYKLLIVEDEEIVRDFLVKNIHCESIGVKTASPASNAFAGLKLAQEALPDIITDIKMPVITGLEIIKQIC